MAIERTASQAPLEPGHEAGLTRELFEELWPDLEFGSGHMAKTPERFVKLLKEMTTSDYFEFTVFDNEENVDEMIIVQDIAYYSLCAHHIVPFFGKAHIAYIPGDCIAGLSKLARTVHFVAKGLWVQEHLTHAIADFLGDHLHPLGLAVVLEGEHLCMSMRGARSAGARTTTSAMRGVFLDPTKGARQEFLDLIRSNR